MIFDDATTAEVPELTRLVNAAYRDPGGTPGWTDERHLLAGPRIDEETLRTDLATGRVLTLRLTGGGPIVACVHLDRADDDTWYLSSVAVDPERQASGLGTALLAEVERQARLAGAPRLQMTVIQLRDTLIAWYERCGYRRTGATVPFPYDDPSVGRPLRDDLVLVVLEKELTPA